MKMKHTVTVANTAMFLKDLHDTIRAGREVRMSDMIRKHHITTRVSQSMQSLGIIGHLKKGKYQKDIIWKVGEPNVKLAETVVKRNQVIKIQEDNHIKRDNPTLWNEMVKGVNSLTDPTKTKQLPDIDIQAIVDMAVKKALTKPVKIRKRLRFRNPFYWV
jgi:hypothetical protein